MYYYYNFFLNIFSSQFLKFDAQIKIIWCSIKKKFDARFFWIEFQFLFYIWEEDKFQKKKK